NTVVKLVYGDNTWLVTAREDNSTPTSKQQRKLLLFVLPGKESTLFLARTSRVSDTALPRGVKRIDNFLGLQLSLLGGLGLPLVE
ncbi:hypothetical protein, partial [uncultured Agathobaculum sp.]|uniref:hypothetical protein n=1 Tax=uncultured Agathobaculum sp. TaxID=2048140 RepID=UPI00296FFDCC